MSLSALPWIIFTVSVLGVLALDLGVFHRHSHVVSVREAGIWTAVWVTLAMCFAGGVAYFRTGQAALEFISGYVIEYSLSVDNIFVFVLIFTMFKVPSVAQHRVLFWGILGAFAMRGTVIGVGAALITRFHWVLYVFGAFLIYSGLKIAFQKGEESMELHENALVRFARRHLPISADYNGPRFTTEENGKRIFTPLVLVLIVIETSDLIFAVDSIPAVFAVTQDPFIVYTSNVFAILGLRSLYFLLAGVVDKFYYLKHALAVILTFVGVKMVISGYVHVPISVSLGVIVGVLAVAMAASAVRARELGESADLVPDPTLIGTDTETKQV